MDKFKLGFSESTIKVGFQLDHMWANVPENECKYGVTKAYWSNLYKSIYIAFKLPNILFMYNKKPLWFSFL
jgi:hypothetical protein